MNLHDRLIETAGETAKVDLKSVVSAMTKVKRARGAVRRNSRNIPDLDREWKKVEDTLLDAERLLRLFIREQS